MLQKISNQDETGYWKEYFGGFILSLKGANSST
jgi:hypothetical protein